MMMYQGWFLKVLFESFSKGPIGFPIYSSSQVRSLHCNQHMAPLFLTVGSLPLGQTSRFFMVLLPLKWVCKPYLPQIFLIVFTPTLGVWYCYMTLGSNFIGNRLDACSTLAVSPIDSIPSVSGFTMVSKKGWHHSPCCFPQQIVWPGQH